ncbi:MAG: PRC-barrel domain-containing protein [Coriobacteriia bacterium]|nr:PRC-barrel domain-containing protein [Coriobacteriia bacterium]
MASGARTLFRSQTLAGRSVVNARGEDLGRIEEFVIDPDRGRIEYAVLSFGEIFGSGEKFFAVPWEALQLDGERRHFVMNVAKETLEEAPGFDPDTWPPSPDRRMFRRAEHAGGHVLSTSTHSHAGHADLTTKSREDTTMAHSERTMTHTRMLSASTLSGNPVVNGQGEDLGSIKELMLDINGGTVVYAVLSFGGFLGLGDKLFAIPWDAMTVEAGSERLVLDVPKEKLENAPGFDKDDWPETGDDEWLGAVYDYYGSERNW